MHNYFPPLFKLALNRCHIVIKTSYKQQIRNHPCTEIILQVDKLFYFPELAMKC